MTHTGSVFLIATVALLATACSPSPKTAKDKDGIAFYSTQDVVKQQLRDPDSAEFSDEYRVGHDAGGEVTSVCGKVNAKNGFGGYAGEQYYVVTGGVLVAFSPDPAVWGQCYEEQKPVDSVPRRNDLFGPPAPPLPPAAAAAFVRSTKKENAKIEKQLIAEDPANAAAVRAFFGDDHPRHRHAVARKLRQER